MNVNAAADRLIEPLPPLVHDELAHIGAGLQFAENPTEYLRSLRGRYGDSFLVDVFGYKLFCVFSPKGLESLYQLKEEDASFGLATFDLLGFKTPTEVFLDTDLQLFYTLLAKKKLPMYLSIIHKVLDLELDRWGDSGELEIFDAIRTLEQRVGYGLWIGDEAAQEPMWNQLKAQFDVLNQEAAFVNPAAVLETIKSEKARERKAVECVSQLLQDLVQRRKSTRHWPADTLSFLYDHFANFGDAECQRRVAHNLININQGFLSNLYAALAWVIIRILQDDTVLRRVEEEITHTSKAFGEAWEQDLEALDTMVYMEQLLMESVRTAQRSLTLRKVLKPTRMDTGDAVYTVNPGVYIATLLSVTNTQTEELRHFDPEHYDGARLRPEVSPAGKETVSTFGHGRHACPAQRFSHMMCKALLIRLLRQFKLCSTFDSPTPALNQMGGVARAGAPAKLSYKRKA